MANIQHIFSGTEESLQLAVERWLEKIDMPYMAQCELSNGSRTDLMLCLSQDRPQPWCVIELKTKLCPKNSSVKDFANYFEQCVKYHMSTGLPVFLGPFFTPTMGVSDYLSGGSQPEYAISAFSALAGRMNVGLLFIHASPGHEHDPDYWYGFRLVLRQQFVAEWSQQSDYYNAWPTDPIELVRFSGAASKSVRVSC